MKEDNPITVADVTDPVPEGKIRTHDGNIIDRADACFFLAEHKEDPNLLKAADGTVYRRINKKGTIRRLTFKENKHQRRKRLAAEEKEYKRLSGEKNE